MITGTKKSEKEYRAISVDSSSSIKDFIKDRKAYFKKYIIGEKTNEERNQAMIVGSLVDCLLFTPDDFEDKFIMSKYKAPNGKMGDFVNALHKFSVLYNDKAFTDIALEAYRESGYDWKFETVINKFTGSDAEGYYNELLLSEKKIIITESDRTNAENIINSFKGNPFTSSVINVDISEDIEVFDQLQYEFDYVLPLKMMADRVIVNRKKKTVSPYDLKVTYNVELFITEFFIKKYAYIQSTLYTVGLTHWIKENFPGYSLQPFRFIVADSINYYDPLIYEVKNQFSSNLEPYFSKGFFFRKIRYPSFWKVINDIAWHKETGLWKISRDNHNDNGIVSMDINFD
jgi:hypothetical protein